MNITVAHTMGGEVSGTIDESIRHAVTKLSHLHFVSNKDALKELLGLVRKKKCFQRRMSQNRRSKKNIKTKQIY